MRVQNSHKKMHGYVRLPYIFMAESSKYIISFALQLDQTSDMVLYFLI